MRVRVTVYVDVDEKKWAQQNGLGAAAAKDIRADVAANVAHLIRELPAVKAAGLSA